MDRDISVFGKRLKEIRDEMDLTLDKFSQLVGIPAQTLNRYELSQRTPKINIVSKIAEKLNVSIDYLLGKTKYKNYHHLSNEVTQLETLESYIESLGYKIGKPFIAGLSSKSNDEAEKLALAADNDPNFPYWEIALVDGQCFTVTISEYEQLIDRIKNLIAFELDYIKNEGFFAQKKK